MVLLSAIMEHVLSCCTCGPVLECTDFVAACKLPDGDWGDSYASPDDKLVHPWASCGSNLVRKEPHAGCAVPATRGEDNFERLKSIDWL